jgi:hypothetical protein
MELLVNVTKIQLASERIASIQVINQLNVMVITVFNALVRKRDILLEKWVYAKKLNLFINFTK